MKTKSAKQTPPASADFAELVNLLSILKEATNQLAALQNSADDSLTEILDDVKRDYASLQETVTKSQTAIETLALKHLNDWFGDTRTIKTPYGTVSFRSSTEIYVPNEEATLILVKHHAEQASLDRACHPSDHDLPPLFLAEHYIRIREELDREALARLDDVTLAQLRVRKIPKQNITIKPATLDLGKAVKQSDQSAPSDPSDK